MIAVIGHLEVDPKDRDALVATSAEAVRMARAASGCVHYAVTADSLDPERVDVAELWSTREALDAFRGDGVDDETGSLIRAFHVQEYDVAGA